MVNCGKSEKSEYINVPGSAMKGTETSCDFLLLPPLFSFFIGVTGLVSLLILSRIQGFSVTFLVIPLVIRTSGCEVGSSRPSGGISPAKIKFIFYIQLQLQV